MAQAIALPPDLSRQCLALARALTAGIRVWALYPPDHPSVVAAIQRLVETIRDAAHGSAIVLGITPSTLVLGGMPLSADQPVADAARILHEHDVLQISFLSDVPGSTASALLALLSTPAEEVRAAGGPAVLWAAHGHVTIAIEQIDYQKILEDKELDARTRRDDVWRSIVSSIGHGDSKFDEAQQQRLLAITNTASEIRDLAIDSIEPKRNIDGSPLLTTQAATVLAVFRHLTGIVGVAEPQRLPDVIQKIAEATAALDPHLVMQMMQPDGNAEDDAVMVARIAAAFDDDKVADLLATALARDGKATIRLAQVFDAIAPDEQRKRRVLAAAHSRLGEQDIGKSSQFRAVWSSMETLLLNYDETPYVSDGYRVSLEGAGARGDLLAGWNLPAELPEWVETLEQDNVRALSVTLITDLLRIETRSERVEEIVADMIALLDDLLFAGDFTLARLVLRELRQSTAADVAPAAARSALTTCGESVALRDASALLGDFDDETLAVFTECCALIGAASTRALLPAFETELETSASRRARDLIRWFRADAIAFITPMVDDERWYVQKNAATLLGATKSVDAVAPLQTLLRKTDTRVLQAAVSALAGIDDPSAARALQTVLRATSGERRLAVIQTLVVEGDKRVVPMVARLLPESDPFGVDHEIVLDMLQAVRHLADERAVGAIAIVMARTRWFQRKRARAFKTASVQALVAIGSPSATQALDDARRRGDRMLRKIIAEVVR